MVLPVIFRFHFFGDASLVRLTTPPPLRKAHPPYLYASRKKRRKRPTTIHIACRTAFQHHTHTRVVPSTPDRRKSGLGMSA
mmetsp:Transcript_27055/g.53088  ORF Transcript_27055/g.53088 Transcript_27055/m.53088 type:complete len:81 (+) Transcript_27055:1256-1498(+)